jgi:hypothetical protein
MLGLHDIFIVALLLFRELRVPMTIVLFLLFICYPTLIIISFLSFTHIQ